MEDALCEREGHPERAAMQDVKQAIRLGRRDVGAISAVHGGIALSTSQLALASSRSIKKTSERLNVLVKTGFLAVKKRAWQLMGETKIEHFYTVTPKGYELLSSAGLAISRPTSQRDTAPANLTHLALTNQFSILLRKGCDEHTEIDCSFLPSWSLLQRIAHSHEGQCGEGIGRVLMSTIKPDGVFCLTKKGGASLLFFLEIDLGGEPLRRHPHSTQTSLTGKLAAYCTYFDTEAYRQDALEIFNTAFKGYRVLLVFDTPSRLQALRVRTNGMGDTHFVWATTVETLTREGVLGKSWEVMAEGDTESHGLLDAYAAPTWTGDANP